MKGKFILSSQEFYLHLGNELYLFFTICCNFLKLSCVNKCRCILVTGAYGTQKTEINISLTAVGLLWTATDFVVKGLISKSVEQPNHMNEGVWSPHILPPPWFRVLLIRSSRFALQRLSLVQQLKKQTSSKFPRNKKLIIVNFSFQFFLSSRNWVQMIVLRYIFSTYHLFCAWTPVISSSNFWVAHWMIGALCMVLLLCCNSRNSW